MRAILFAFVTVILSANFAFAETGFYGETVEAPKTVKVKTKSGDIKEYQITSYLNTGDIYNTSVSLLHNGLSSKCGAYLGQLAESFKMSIRLSDGSVKTASVEAGTDQSPVSVFGMCQDNSNILDELQIDVKNGAVHVGDKK